MQRILKSEHIKHYESIRVRKNGTLIDVSLGRSPVTYVERVKTPVLLVHGDGDSVPILLTVQYYGALYRPESGQK